MADEDNIVDVEVVEESDILPAVIARETHGAEPPIEATRSQTADGRDWPHGPRPERRCTAHSSRTGEPCKNAAIKGHNVCRYHGGAAKQVKQAARIRLENAADLMAKQLLGIALTADSEQVKLTAIRDALDRAGLKAPSEVVLSQGEAKPYETVFDSIGGDPDAAGFASVPSGYESAGVGTPPPPAMVDPDGYGGGAWTSSPEGSDSPRDDPPRHADCRDDDRDTQPGGGHGARTARSPAPREVHVSGMAAIRMANEANRHSGVFDEQRAIESPHKRYRRL